MDSHFAWTGKCINAACAEPQSFVVPGLIVGARAIMKCDRCDTAYELVVSDAGVVVFRPIKNYPTLMGRDVQHTKLRERSSRG